MTSTVSLSQEISSTDASSVEWRIGNDRIDYRDAEQFMEARAAGIAAGSEREMVWLLEHPPLYTAGTSAKQEDLLMPDRFPVYKTGRGGQYTYHGPGQRVGYVMLDLNKRGKDLRAFVTNLERWLIQTLAEFNVVGETRPDRVGVWVQRPDKGLGREDKIAAIGVRVRKWVTFHGVSLNVEPDLDHFSGIVPCGIQQHGVTSLVDLGLPVTYAEVDAALKRQFTEVFG